MNQLRAAHEFQALPIGSVIRWALSAADDEAYGPKWRSTAHWFLATNEKMARLASRHRIELVSRGPGRYND